MRDVEAVHDAMFEASLPQKGFDYSNDCISVIAFILIVEPVHFLHILQFTKETQLGAPDECQARALGRCHDLNMLTTFRQYTDLEPQFAFDQISARYIVCVNEWLLLER